MNKRAPIHSFPRSVVLPVDNRGCRALNRVPPGGAFEYVCKTRCPSITSSLNEANQAWKFLIALIVEDSLPELVQWMGIIEQVDCSGSDSRFQIGNVKDVVQLALQLPPKTHRPAPAIISEPYVISTPVSASDYLFTYEAWLRDKYNPFFYEECLFLPVDLKALRNLSFDLNGVQKLELLSSSSAAGVLFDRTVSLGKVLTIIFGDINRNLEIVGIAVADAIVANGEKIDISFVCADEFLNLQSAIPVSTLQLSEGDVLEEAIRDHGYAVCESPWYTTLYLDRVFCSPTTSEFTHALTNVHVTLEERSMLWRHVTAADRTLSMSSLASSMKYDDGALAYLRYSMLAARIAEFVAFPSEYFEDTLHCLALPLDLPGGYKEQRWQMRPELANALVELGWVSSRGEQYELRGQDS